MKKFLVMFLCVMIFVYPVKAYSAYNYDYMGNAIPSQAGYDVESVLYFDMNEPQDIFYDGKNFYIADTGNNRILVPDINLENIVKTYDKFTYPDGTETYLNSPEGVYIAGNHVNISRFVHKNFFRKKSLVLLVYFRNRFRYFRDDFQIRNGNYNP